MLNKSLQILSKTLKNLLSSRKARENNSLFFEILSRRRPIGPYMSLPYLQPYGLPVITMPFFDKTFG
jgi:hypothetical protein